MPAETVADFAAFALTRLRDHFPEVSADPAQHLLKLGEEYGELTGACMRYLGRSRRPGTLEDVTAEAADVLITLHVLAAALGIDLEAAWRDKAAAIMGRPWKETGKALLSEAGVTTGRTLGRTLYIVTPGDDRIVTPGDDRKADRCIGLLDTRELADWIVATVNAAEAAKGNE